MRDERQREALPPLVGGILIGGSSRRMGSPKALLDWAGSTFIERIADALAAVVPEIWLLGWGVDLPARLARLPVVADARGVQGPVAGVLGALAARPDAAWLILSCDQPLLSAATLEWLKAERQPGRMAVLPRLAPGRIEPFPGIYEPGCRAALAALTALATPAASVRSAAAAVRTRRGSFQPLAECAGVYSASVPAHLVDDFRGANTLEELADLRQNAGRAARKLDRDG